VIFPAATGSNRFAAIVTFPYHLHLCSGCFYTVATALQQRGQYIPAVVRLQFQ
jgi:hypothetical protein